MLFYHSACILKNVVWSDIFLSIAWYKYTMIIQLYSNYLYFYPDIHIMKRNKILLF